MSKPGRTPQPTALKKLRGNPGRRPLNDAEPAMTAEKPPCPVWLSKYAKTVWRRLSPSLFAQGILRYEDVFAFAGYCEAVAHFKRATEELRAAKLTQVSESDWQAIHPAVSNFNNALSGLIKAGTLFGLDPSARSRLKVEAVEREASLAEVLFKTVNGD